MMVWIDVLYRKDRFLQSPFACNLCTEKRRGTSGGDGLDINRGMIKK